MKIIVSEKLARAMKNSVSLLGEQSITDAFTIKTLKETCEGSKIMRVVEQEGEVIIEVKDDFLIDVIDATKHHFASLFSIGKSVGHSIIVMASSLAAVMEKWKPTTMTPEETKDMW